MAKSDFAFTYYDGDAARDMSHMNRLERGAYTDIIISQRKFGHLSKDQIKKILGRDFEECFSAIELILKTDLEGKFFIEWLENSELRAKKHSQFQSEKRKGKTKIKPNESETKPNDNKIKPLGDGYGDGSGIEDDLEKGVQGKKQTFEENWKLAFDELTLEDYKMKYKFLDLKNELDHFRLKCNSAKDDYHNRSPQGLRLGFLSQLKGSKNTKNESNKTTTGATRPIHFEGKQYSTKL